MTAEQTPRDKRVELVHIAILLGGLLVIFNATLEYMGGDTPLLIPIAAAAVWTLGYYAFVKLLPRSWSGQA